MSNLDDRLERGGAAVRRMAEAVPLATPGLTVDAGRAGGRRPPIGLIVVASLTLVVALAATLLFLGPNRGADMVGSDATSTSVPQTEPDIRITLSEDTTDEALERAVAAVTALDGVRFAQGLNRDAAFAEFSELFADCPGLVEVASQDLSVFPIAIKVWVDVDANAEDRSEIVDVANRVLTVMMASEFGLVDIELTRDAPPAENDCVSPTTTMAVPAELEQAGVDLVEEITADGYVSRDEFVRAVEGMAACMTDNGLTGVNWAVDELWATGEQGGGWSMGYDSPTDDAAEQAIYALCFYSYIPETELRGEPPIPEIAPLSPVRVTCSAELSESFSCSALIDGDPNTTWQAPDGGIGATITVLFASPVQITDITFENEGGDAYIRNARVRGVAVITDDLVDVVAFELADSNDAPQRFEIRSLNTLAVTLEITSGYPGQSFGDQVPFTDLAIGEITFRGRPAPAAAAVNWLGAGESIADEVLLALGPPHEPIPGTAVRLAWTSAYNGGYDLGLFAFMAAPPEQVSSASVWYCVMEAGLLAGSDTVVVGSTECSLTLEQLHEHLTFGSSGGGSCVDPLTLMWTIWGIPEPVETVTFHMSDGTELVGEATDGIVQVAWGRDIVITGATFAGITEAQTAKLRELSDSAQTCAELNGPGNGGG